MRRLGVRVPSPALRCGVGRGGPGPGVGASGVRRSGLEPGARLESTPGGVPERSKGTDCKSVGEAFGGSNPPPSTIFVPLDLGGNSSVARASAFQAEGRGFESRFPLHFFQFSTVVHRIKGDVVDGLTVLSPTL